METRFLYQPPPGDPDYLLIDEFFVAVNKPSGLLSVPGRGEDRLDCVISRVQARFPDALTVHRLDLATSGVLLLARGAEAQSKISKAFQNRRVDKRYVAVVDGSLKTARGEIDLPLIVDWPNRPRQMVDFELGRPSLTRYERESVAPDGLSSRVRLFPVTGRSHQLRVHLASLGHPILGDDLYAGEAQFRAPRLLLHAEWLSFPHPLTGETVEVLAPTPF